MKQCVCLACCLVSEPELIILDEPLNGLDADGVLWLQEFIRSHRNNGGAVLLSSHLMAEMQTVADSVVILDRGEVVARGAIESLAGDSRTEISVEESPHSLVEIFKDQGFTDVLVEDSTVSVAGIAPSKASYIAFSHGFSVCGLSETKTSLEDIYRTVLRVRK